MSQECPVLPATPSQRSWSMHVPVELWNRTSGFLGLDDHGCDCKYIQMSHSCYHTDSSIKIFCLQIFSKAASCSCRNGWAEQPSFCTALCKTSFRCDNGMKPQGFGSILYPPVQCREEFVTISRSYQARAVISPPSLNFWTILISWGAKKLVCSSKWELSLRSGNII